MVKICPLGGVGGDSFNDWLNEHQAALSSTSTFGDGGLNAEL